MAMSSTSLSDDCGFEMTFEFDVFDDISQNVNDMARQGSLGYFGKARSMYNDALKKHRSVFPVFAEYLRILYDQGDLKTLKATSISGGMRHSDAWRSWQPLERCIINLFLTFESPGATYTNNTDMQHAADCVARHLEYTSFTKLNDEQLMAVVLLLDAQCWNPFPRDVQPFFTSKQDLCNLIKHSLQHSRFWAAERVLRACFRYIHRGGGSLKYDHLEVVWNSIESFVTGEQVSDGEQELWAVTSILQAFCEEILDRCPEAIRPNDSRAYSLPMLLSMLDQRLVLVAKRDILDDFTHSRGSIRQQLIIFDKKVADVVDSDDIIWSKRDFEHLLELLRCADGNEDLHMSLGIRWRIYLLGYGKRSADIRIIPSVSRKVYEQRDEVLARLRQPGHKPVPGGEINWWASFGQWYSDLYQTAPSGISKVLFGRLQVQAVSKHTSPSPTEPASSDRSSCPATIPWNTHESCTLYQTARLPNFNPTLFETIFIRIFHIINLFIPWHHLPGLIGVFNLDFMRVELRNYNLHDGYVSADAQGKVGELPATEKRYIGTRNSDGSDNSLEMRKMGCAGMRFGRNFPRKQCQKPTEDELWNPSPRLVSQTFMARKPEEFKPATTLNLLAAAWIQFQVHDWFNHEDSDKTYDIPLQSSDEWPADHMKLFQTKQDEVLDPSDKLCPGYRNVNTAWWDGSQIYGSSEAVTNSLRSGHPHGKLVLDEVGKERRFIPRNEEGTPKTGFSDNWWLGVEMLHTLFALEHNAICERIRTGHPSWTGDQIFDKARIVNCALMAKIHTVEWTPAILAHPALQIGMSANWWGIVGETLTKAVGRISKTSEAISGIPGSGVDHQGIPYSLTEEFVSVYRMHSLIPDNIALFGAVSGRHIDTVPTEDVIFTKSLDPIKAGATFADAFYSFGINYPGSITNNNYSTLMQRLTTPDGQVRDMGTVDILRDRERAVPRYTAFRRMLRMTVPKTFEELTGGNKELAAKLSEVYDGDIDKVDTLVGSHSEPLPQGFGFSDTAFRIFILMASRRLKSDRFIAGAWNAEMYTKEGFEWVQNTTMSDVLSRHFPELNAVMPKSTNVFAPWEKLPESKKYPGIETNAR